MIISANLQSNLSISFLGEDFAFGCNGNQNSAWIYFIWTILIRELSKDYLCEVLSKRFQGRCHLKQLLTMHDA